MNSSETRRPRVKQAVIVFCSGLLLCVGSCAGFLASVGGGGLLQSLAVMAAITFLFGLLTVIGAAIVLIIEAILKSKSGGNEANP